MRLATGRHTVTDMVRRTCWVQHVLVTATRMLRYCDGSACVVTLLLFVGTDML